MQQRTAPGHSSGERRWPAMAGASLSYPEPAALGGIFFRASGADASLVFKFYPLLEAFRLSFYRYDLLSPPVFTGLANYHALWENPLFHQSFWVSVKYMFGVSVPEWFLALGLALLLNRAMPGRSVIRLAYFFPIAMSQIVVAMVWKFMYHPHGLVNTHPRGLRRRPHQLALDRGDGACQPDRDRHLAGHPALRRDLPCRPSGDPEGLL